MIDYVKFEFWNQSNNGPEGWMLLPKELLRELQKI